jgi:sulfopyruvate decarboxylase TPP-binding subunit
VQRPEEELIHVLKSNNVDFTASLPCEKIKTLLQMV